MTHNSTSGVAHFAAADDRDALMVIRDLLSYIPSNNMEDPPQRPTDDPDDRADELLNSLVPDNPNHPYEIKMVIASRADFEWAAAAVREHELDQRFNVLFGPVWGAVQPRDLCEWLLASRLRARLQLQLHKLIWGPEKRGV